MKNKQKKPYTKGGIAKSRILVALPMPLLCILLIACTEKTSKYEAPTADDIFKSAEIQARIDKARSGDDPDDLFGDLNRANRDKTVTQQDVMRRFLNSTQNSDDDLEQLKKFRPKDMVATKKKADFFPKRLGSDVDVDAITSSRQLFERTVRKMKVVPDGKEVD